MSDEIAPEGGPTTESGIAPRSATSPAPTSTTTTHPTAESPTATTPPAAAPASVPAPVVAPAASVAEHAPTVDAPVPNGDAPATGEGGAEGSTGPRKRRRRGSRGGRNRRRTTSAAEGSDGGADTLDGDDEDGGDWNDAAADRGLTTDDIAAQAAEDAGVPLTPGGPAPLGSDERPKIGDSRPAPPAAAVAPVPAAAAAARNGGDAAAAGTGPSTTRRRRRGGRGRGKAAGGGAASGGPVTPVEADLGIEDDALDELDADMLERRRGRTRKGRPTGRYLMVVHVHSDGPTHVAVLEGRSLVEHAVSRPTDSATSIDGNIYLGRVQNVLPGMEAAFVDIGTPKNGVLYRGDVAYDDQEVDGERPKIERMLKNGQSVLVQVTKNPIGAKGARLTQEVSLAGRFVVMVPNQPDTYGISKRLPDDERKRLRRILEDLKPADAGLIVRTAAEGASPEELERDMRRLKAQWEQISTLAANSKPPVLLYREPSMVVRRIREEFTKEYRGIVIDDPEIYGEVRSYVEAIAPELAERVEFYDEPGLPIFERFHIHEQLVKALDRKVWLPSGGSLIIERTEALTVIDVNTGKNVGSTNLEETVFRNNLEAADEVARQLRLRDIGGIIVIDFIDMEIKKNRDAVLRGFKDALARDKTRTQVFEISELGLVEMTRKRISEGLVESFSRTCETCQGRGFLVDESLLS